ncbi:MAG: hypothetical protein RIM72_01400 [Alphaproteobacteria bacterium]
MEYDEYQYHLLDAETNASLSKLVTPLLINLHNGSIKSWGGPDSTDPELAEFFFDEIEVDPEAWAKGVVDWEKSEISNIWNYRSPHISRYYGICIDAKVFWNLFGTEQFSNEEYLPNVSTRRGRTPQYDWVKFHAEIAIRADLDGLPETQAELEKEMASWCLEEWGKEPGESTLRSKISPIYNHPRRARGQ